MRLLTATTTAILATACVAPTYGAVIGQIVAGGTTATATGNVDIYYFEIANGSGGDLFTFNNLDFDGTFIEGTTNTKVGTGLPEPAPGFFFAATFAADDAITPTTFGTVTSTASDFDLASVATLGGPWVEDGATENIIVFSVPVGGPAPVFVGGDAVVGGQNQAIVPEPTSLALLGLGSLFIARRRRG